MRRVSAVAMVLGACVLCWAAPRLWITEVAPAETGSRDWVELFVAEDGDYGGWWLLAGGFDEVVRVLPSRDYRAGDHILIRMGMAVPDDTAAVRGCWRFSSSWPGLVGTDGVLLLADPSGVWRDAMGYANRDGTLSATTLQRWRLLQDSGMWRIATGTDVAAVESALADWSGGGAGMSLARQRSAAGMPADTDDPGDWFRIRRPTPGWGYGGRDGGEASVCTDAPGGVFRPSRRPLAIRWSVDGPDWIKTIRVVHVRDLRETVRLMDADATGWHEPPWSGVCQGTIEWCGRDATGDPVAPGIYVVVLEASDPRTRRSTVVRTAVAVAP